ncbi:MAG: MCE family protein [Flavobacteriales bacterium]|nr:MCE family protein [Flavobacteriales bacterium]
MKKIEREYTIAGVAIAGILLLIFGINYLKGLDLLTKRNVYHAVYNDISGVTSASPVFMNGLKVGQVVNTELKHDGSGRVVVSFQLNERQLKLPKDTKLQIYSADLFTRALQIIRGNAEEIAQAGDTLVGDAELSLTDAVGAQIDPLKRKAEAMFANVDSLLSALQRILNDSTVGDIDASFSSIRGTLENLNRTSARLDALIATESSSIHAVIENLRRVTNNLDSYHAQLNSILTNLDTMSGTLAGEQTRKAMADLAESSAKLKGIMTGLEQGEGSMGALLKNDTLYDNLQQASRELDLLLEDLRLNPKQICPSVVIRQEGQAAQAERFRCGSDQAGLAGR